MSTVVARFELDKLRTVRAPWVVLGAGGAASVLFAAFLAFVLPRFADEAAPSPRELLVLVARTNAAMPVAVAVAVVGALTSELRAGFMLHSLLRARGAWPLWRAKTLVAALLATGCALACTVLAGVLVVLLAGPVPVQVWLSVAVGSALQAVCWALIGLGVAALARRAGVRRARGRPGRAVRGGARRPGSSARRRRDPRRRPAAVRRRRRPQPGLDVRRRGPVRRRGRTRAAAPRPPRGRRRVVRRRRVVARPQGPADRRLTALAGGPRDAERGSEAALCRPVATHVLGRVGVGLWGLRLVLRVLMLVRSA